MLTHENVFLMLKNWAGFQGHFEESWSSRPLHMQCVTTYSDPEYAVFFFYLEGSPPKVHGFIRPFNKGYRATASFNDNAPETRYFDLSFRRISKEELY